MAKKRPSKPDHAPAAPQKEPPSSEPAASNAQYRLDLARATFPRGLYDAETRKNLGLPDNPDEYASYVVELNLQKNGGLAAADNAFKDLYRRTIVENAEDRPPVRVSKTYYSCFISMNEARRLVKADEAKGGLKQRSIYRIWPDFRVSAKVDRSVSTVKGDAALKSYAASGEGVLWAVIDSGIMAEHPHFGKIEATRRAAHADKARAAAAEATESAEFAKATGAEDAVSKANAADNAAKAAQSAVALLQPGDDDARRLHTLLAPEVATLHRFFGRERIGKLRIPTPLPDPDANPDMDPSERDKLVARHVELALTDEFGHGTHVAGIIGGGLNEATAIAHVFERKFKTDTEGMDKVEIALAERQVRDPLALRGVAPQCKLVSLRVLDDNGDGFASDIIRALEYVRDRLNGDPKMLVVHGVNLSVGYEFDAEMFACGGSPLCVEVDRLVQAGVVVVAAAGNTGYGTLAAKERNTKVGLANTINDPGNARNAITVGATHRDSPHTYGVSFFSSKGPTGDGRLKPDLVAPGERITSCAAGKKLRDVLQNQPGEPGAAYYVDDSGTSMAVPHVAGAIAAFLSIRKEFMGKPLDIKDIFLKTATSLGRDRYFEGYGLVDLMRAIQSV
jgi:subtilisin family serine protease